MRTSLLALASLAILTTAGTALADDPPPPPAPKAAAGPAPTDVHPSAPVAADPATPDPVPPHGPGMMHHHGRGEEVGGPPVTVTLSSDRPHAMLFRSTSTGYVAAGQGGGLTMTNVRTFVPVCAAPCTVATDANATYRIGGEGVTLSDEFRLPAGQGSNVDLKVHGGSSAARKGGAALIGGGITALVAGGALLVAGYLSRPDYTDAKYAGEPRFLKDDLDSSRSVRTAGFIVAPLGALFILTGSILTAISPTHVETGTTRLATGPKPRLTANGMALSF